MIKDIDHEYILSEPCEDVHLKHHDPSFTAHFKDKHDAKDTLHQDLKQLELLQDIFFADQRRAMLIIFQGMDAAGKDGAIRHVMSSVSPQGVDVYPFKQPSAQELSHDYLWRCAKVLPERGRIAIFNRSYYEELTIVRVHQEALAKENLPVEPSGAALWKERYQDINAFEEHLVRNGTLILKFFLHLSKDEQKARFLERIDNPGKNWKISSADIHERTYWDAYQNAYDQLLIHTSTIAAPWHIIPADHKWFARAAVGNVIVSTLKKLDLHYPSMTDKQKSLLAIERKKLEVHSHAAH
jgi:PPK2 family polyphosphate:nucleotide phosphotransferase